MEIKFSGKSWSKVPPEFENQFSAWREVPWDGGPTLEDRREAIATIPAEDALLMNNELVWGEIKICQERHRNPKKEIVFMQTVVLETKNSIKTTLPYRQPFYFEGDPLWVDPAFRLEEDENNA